MRISRVMTLAVAVLHHSSSFPTMGCMAFASWSRSNLVRSCYSNRSSRRNTNCRKHMMSGTNGDRRTVTTTGTNAALSVPVLPTISPTAKRIFWVRHGEVINPGGDRAVYYGAMDVPLSPLGEAEAYAAASYLQQFDLQHIACSPLSRAIFGATKVMELQQQGAVVDQGKNVKNDLIIFDGFTELDRGEWCGLTLDEIGRDVMSRFDACDESVTPKGGESYPQLKKRVLKARDELLAMVDGGRSAAVVSHLQVTRSVLSEALDMPTEEMTQLKVATASITCIDYDDDGMFQTVHFQSFKPDTGLGPAKDGAN